MDKFLNTAVEYLKKFINPHQLKTMIDGTKGEEGQFFREKLLETYVLILSMPATYETDGDDKATYQLHYFRGGCDWWIKEKDKEDRQLQAFGYACLSDPQNAELGYINIEELLYNRVELDLYWTPCTLDRIKKGDL